MLVLHEPNQHGIGHGLVINDLFMHRPDVGTLIQSGAHTAASRGRELRAQSSQLVLLEAVIHSVHQNGEEDVRISRAGSPGYPAPVQRLLSLAKGSYWVAESISRGKQFVVG